MEFKHDDTIENSEIENETKSEKKPVKKTPDSKKVKPIENEINTEKKPIKKTLDSQKVKLVKIIAISIISLVVIIIGVIIFTALFGNNGEKVADKLGADKLGAKIGSEIVVAEKNAKVHLAIDSASKALNKQGDFDYIYESDKLIKVDGIKVPKWAIKVVMKDKEVFSVSYRNFNEQKKSYKGEKLKKPITSSKIEIGMTLGNVKELFGISPLSITYFEDTTEYRYMYYFINEDKDEERSEIIVSFDDDMNVSKVENVDLSKNGCSIY